MNRPIEFRAWDKNYEIGSDGSVWSINFNNTGIRKQMKTYLDNDGYLYVFLQFGKRKKKMVHRMVAETFIPRPSIKHQVNHKNRIRSDNRLENLEWVTSQENTLHGWRNGRVYQQATKLRMSKLFSGENNPKAKLTKQIVTTIRNLRNNYGWTLSALANDYGVSKSTISSIATGRIWK